MTVYASWDGATTVAAWQLLSGSSPGALTPVVIASDTGFETAITAPRAAYVSVRALDSSGRVLGASPAMNVP
jgi:hypothetical protein